MTLSGRTLLVLGASVNQVPVIQRAVQLGVRVVTVDNTPTNPGHAMAAVSHAVDTTDLPAVLVVARREGIHGILAAATDVALPTAAGVAAALGLVGPPISAVQPLVVKSRFRALQAELGLPFPAAWTAGAAGRFIAKPCVGSGSRGARIAEGGDVEAARDEAARISLDGASTVESMLEGPQHTLEGMMHGGGVAAMLMTDRRTAPPPHVATCGHRVPSATAPEVTAALVAQIEAVFAALNYRDGPFDADAVAAPGGAVLLELTPRVGGNSMMRLMEVATGSDYRGGIVAHALGVAGPPLSPFSPQPTAVEIFGADRDGTLYWDRAGLEALRREPWVAHIHMDLAPGAEVRRFTDGRARIGEVIVTGAAADLDSRLVETRARLGLLVR
jgi:biotin carboxylase